MDYELWQFSLLHVHLQQCPIEILSCHQSIENNQDCDYIAPPFSQDQLTSWQAMCCGCQFFLCWSFASVVSRHLSSNFLSSDDFHRLYGCFIAVNKKLQIIIIYHIINLNFITVSISDGRPKIL